MNLLTELLQRFNLSDAEQILFQTAALLLSLAAVWRLIRHEVGGIFHGHNEPPPEYDQQINSLEETKKNIQGLLDYINTQEKQLARSKASVEAMKSEEERLKPLVDADRKIVEALFRAQEERNRKAGKRERWIGFSLGILASFIASIVFSLVVLLLNQRK